MAVTGALVAVLLFTGFYQVGADEVVVVQRFGKYVRIAGPGPHFRLPFVSRPSPAFPTRHSRWSLASRP